MSTDRSNGHEEKAATPRPDEAPEDEITPLPEQSAAEPNSTMPDAASPTKVNEGLVIRDPAGNVVKAVEQLPISIGRGSECNLSLEGEGALGIYARLRRNIGDGVTLEKIRPDTTIASHGVSGDTHELANGDQFIIDGHAFAIDWPEMDTGESGATPERRQYLKYGVIGVLVIAGLLFAFGGFMQLRSPDVSGTPDQAQSQESVAVPSAESDSGTETREADSEEAQAGRDVVRPLWTLEAMLVAVFGEVDIDSSGRSQAENDGVADIDTLEINDSGPEESGNTDTSPAAETDPGVDTARVGARSRERGMVLYHEGNAAEAAQVMRATARRSEMQGSADANGLLWLADRVDDAVGLSADAHEDLANGQLTRALKKLSRLGEIERSTLTPGGLSRYYREAETALATALRKRMVSARHLDNPREAYRWADRLLELREDDEAAAFIATRDEAARDRYDYAFELEMIDIGNATRVWREVVALVPAESPWHQRAVAKIRQYHPNSE